MSSYWINRAIEDEEKAQALASSFSKRQQQAYIDAYKSIEKEIDALYSQIISQPQGLEYLTRSQLWRYKKYTDLKNTIANEVESIAGSQYTIMDMCIEEVFKQTMGFEADALDSSFSAIGKEQLRQALNSNWSGKNYSERIWQNTNALAERLNKDIADMICQGKSPEDVKKQLMEDFNTSYRVADRLVRTEASYTYNTAAIESYKNAGVEKVEFIAEDDCCDQCEEYRGQEFDIANVPMLPIHPNCRCCYAPVVNLEI